MISNFESHVLSATKHKSWLQTAYSR